MLPALVCRQQQFVDLTQHPLHSLAHSFTLAVERFYFTLRRAHGSRFSLKPGAKLFGFRACGIAFRFGSVPCLALFLNQFYGLEDFLLERLKFVHTDGCRCTHACHPAFKIESSALNPFGV